jgi:hypothetical protein
MVGAHLLSRPRLVDYSLAQAAVHCVSSGLITHPEQRVSSYHAAVRVKPCASSSEIWLRTRLELSLWVVFGETTATTDALCAPSRHICTVFAAGVSAVVVFVSVSVAVAAAVSVSASARENFALRLPVRGFNLLSIYIERERDGQS